jgi:hypothetical protein
MLSDFIETVAPYDLVLSEDLSDLDQLVGSSRRKRPRMSLEGGSRGTLARPGGPSHSRGAERGDQRLRW